MNETNETVAFKFVKLAPLGVPIVVEEKSCESVRLKEVACSECHTNHLKRINETRYSVILRDQSNTLFLITTSFDLSALTKQKIQYEMIAKIINKHGIYFTETE